MRKQQWIDRLQNLALILLALSAIFLFTCTPLFRNHFSDQVQALFTPHPQGGDSPQDASAYDAMPAAQVMITANHEYGRCGQLSVSPGDPLCEQLAPLLRDAVGTAEAGRLTADLTLQNALDDASVFLSYPTPLPLSVIARWLDTQTDLDLTVRSIALSCHEGSWATLYLLDSAGSIYRCATSLSSAAVRETAEQFAPNSALFAYETNYTTLTPYAILHVQPGELPQLQSALPEQYTLPALLQVLDFNVHTQSRYPETDGTEVVVESPRTLRFSPGGTVSYTGEGEITASLFKVPCAGDEPTQAEALLACWHLATALTDAAGASPLVLRSAEPAPGGWRISFGYQPLGWDVFFDQPSSELSSLEALSVTVTGRTITAFTYRCRAYSSTEDLSLLMPPVQAAAVASVYPGAGLTVGYADDGSGVLSARWLAG